MLHCFALLCLESLCRNHGGRVMEKQSWRRNHGEWIMEEESLSKNHGKWSRKKLETARSLTEAPRRHPGGIQEAPRMLPRDTQEAPRKLPGGSQEAARSTKAPRGPWERVGNLYDLLCIKCVHLWLLRRIFECAMILDASLQAEMLPGSVNGAAAQTRPLSNTVRTPWDKSVWGLYYIHIMYDDISRASSVLDYKKRIWNIRNIMLGIWHIRLYLEYVILDI